MRASFPVKKFPWKTHLPAFIFVMIAIFVSISVYDSLPDRLATTFDFKNNPTGYMNKATYTYMILGFMAIMTGLFLVLDRLYFYFTFPVPLMSAISGAMQLFILFMHIFILDLHNLPEMSVITSIIVLCAVPCLYFFIHLKIFQRDEGEGPRGLPLWQDVSPHSWLAKVFFFVRPILPDRVITYDDGLVIKASLYRIMVPWDQIRLIEHATVNDIMRKMAIKLTSAPSRSVKLYQKDQKLPIIFSISDESRLISEWKQRAKKA
jgi:hypothetical protein